MYSPPWVCTRAGVHTGAAHLRVCTKVVVRPRGQAPGYASVTPHPPGSDTGRVVRPTGPSVQISESGNSSPLPIQI